MTHRPVRCVSRVCIGGLLELNTATAGRFKAVHEILFVATCHIELDISKRTVTKDVPVRSIFTIGFQTQMIWTGKQVVESLHALL